MIYIIKTYVRSLYELLFNRFRNGIYTSLLYQLLIASNNRITVLPCQRVVHKPEMKKSEEFDLEQRGVL